MGTIAMTSSETVPLPPSSVFDSFATSAGGWLFDAVCDQLAVGAHLSLRVPYGAGLPFTIYGRIIALKQDCQIVIEHAQPWHGRIRIRLSPLERDSTRVTLVSEIDEMGIDWLVRRGGLPVPFENSSSAQRVGLLTCKTGPGAVFALATENAASLAIEDADTEPGRAWELVVGDDGTDPVLAGVEAERLIRSGCRAIVASVTSQSFAQVQRVAERYGVLAVHAVLNEGGPRSPSAIRLGERPAQQIAAAVGPVMREAASSSWFVVGHTYSWSRAASRVAHAAIPAAGGRIVGEARVKLGSTDYRPVVEQIVRSGAGVVLTSLVGADEVRFEKTSYDLGLRDRAVTLSLVLEESTRELIGPDASLGIWVAMGYFESLPGTTNAEFTTRYRDRFGPWAPPLSTMSEAVYAATRLVCRALVDEPDGSARTLLQRVRSSRLNAPRGLLTFGDEETYNQRITLATAGTQGFALRG
jgi:branched-chain amino acid transport system substrate-binding protein